MNDILCIRLDLTGCPYRKSEFIAELYKKYIEGFPYPEPGQTEEDVKKIFMFHTCKSTIQCQYAIEVALTGIQAKLINFQ